MEDGLATRSGGLRPSGVRPRTQRPVATSSDGVRCDGALCHAFARSCHAYPKISIKCVMTHVILG